MRTRRVVIICHAFNVFRLIAGTHDTCFSPPSISMLSSYAQQQYTRLNSLSHLLTTCSQQLSLDCTSRSAPRRWWRQIEQSATLSPSPERCRRRKSRRMLLWLCHSTRSGWRRISPCSTKRLLSFERVFQNVWTGQGTEHARLGSKHGAELTEAPSARCSSCRT